MAGSFALAFACSAMAVTARRTLAKVKSSAMRPRHPEVPNLMGEVAMRRYSRLERVESRKLKNNGVAGKNAEEGRGKQNRTGNLRNAGRGKANRAHRGWQEACRVREHDFEPRRFGLYVEGKA